MTYVALLRGINVGGKSTVSMAKLKECLESLGFDDVRTYINSGNAIFETEKTSGRALEATIEKKLKRVFGFPIKVIIRSRPEMQRIARSMPASWGSSRNHRNNVVFLSHVIDKKAILDSFEPKPFEQLSYAKGALFWSVPMKDITRSAMLKINRDPMYKEMTIRSPNTVRKILDIMQQ
jgi:uncharacterized protein (DUF1697 family)